MRTKCRSIATFHRPIHSHWSLPLITLLGLLRCIMELTVITLLAPPPITKLIRNEEETVRYIICASGAQKQLMQVCPECIGNNEQSWTTDRFLKSEFDSPTFEATIRYSAARIVVQNLRSDIRYYASSMTDNKSVRQQKFDSLFMFECRKDGVPTEIKWTWTPAITGLSTTAMAPATNASTSRKPFDIPTATGPSEN